MNREQIDERRFKADADWRNRFNELGLSEHFDFICRDWDSDKGRKAEIRCKSCGETFHTWGLSEIIKGRQARLLCPRCGAASDNRTMWTRSELCEQVMNYYVNGHSAKETAQKFNLTKYQIENEAKARGLTNGKTIQKVNENKRKEAEKRLKEHLQILDFEYLGGYTTKDGKVKIQCKKCGTIIERTVKIIKDGKTVCSECKKAETRKRQEQERQKRFEQQAEATQQRKKEQELRQKQKEKQFQLERNQKLDAVYVCKICGKEYTPRQYIQSAGLTLFSNVGYCSHECKRKAANRLRKTYKRSKDTHRHRARKYGCEYDPSVNLDKLIERDGLRCAICGEMCDLNDRSWSEFSGPLYPSIDHIIPMAKGGGHTWDNVQVAHIICNSYKSDKTDEEAS